MQMGGELLHLVLLRNIERVKGDVSELFAELVKRGCLIRTPAAGVYLPSLRRVLVHEFQPDTPVATRDKNGFSHCGVPDECAP
jgi:hypothetical protein